MRILLLDDQDVVRRGALEILREAHPATVFAEARDLTEAERALQAASCDLALVEPGLATGEGREALRGMAARYPTLPVLAFSALPEVPHAARALRLGVRGFLPKSAGAAEFLRAVGTVLAGRRYVSQSLVNALGAMLAASDEPKAQDLLSRRELEIARCLARGEGPTRAGRRLGLSAKTIWTYRSRALTKLGLDSVAELIHNAARLGLLDAEDPVEPVELARL